MKFAISLFISLVFFSMHGIAQTENYTVPMCKALSLDESYSPSSQRSLGRLYQSNTHWLFKDKELITEMDFNDEALYALIDITKTLKSQGIDFIIAPIPTRALVYPNEVPDEAGYDFEAAKSTYLNYIDTLTSHNINVINFEKMLNQTTPDLYYKRDSHWTTYGAKLAASIIGENIKKRDDYSTFSKSKFETVYNGVYSLEGSMHSTFHDICHTSYPLEYMKRYSTHKSYNEDSLFDSEENHEIILLGTSFSALSNLNFSGHLSQALDVEVINHAVSGGNINGSFTQYFSDSAYLDNPPKIIIWEFPYEYKKFVRPHVYSLLLPHIKQRSCEKVAIKTNKTISLGANHVILNGGQDFEFLKHQDIFYQIEFEQKNIHRFDTISHYIERRKYKVKNEASKRLINDGIFIVDLSHIKKLDDLHFFALDLNIDDPQLVGTKVTTKICIKEKT